MPSRPQALCRRPVPCAVVLCAGVLAGALMPGAAHAAGVRGHRHVSSQIIGGSRDDRGSTVSPTHAAAPRVHNAG